MRRKRLIINKSQHCVKQRIDRWITTGPIRNNNLKKEIITYHIKLTLKQQDVPKGDN
jgi:hypothetical protein